jgi:NADH dehydrogenase
MANGETTQPPRVVIIGAGFGGLQAARNLARAPARVTLVDRNNYHLFQPLLYQVATAALSPADIAVPVRSVLHRQRNIEVVLGEVIGVDTQRRAVHVRDSAGAHDVSLPYDYLVVATGAMGSYFGHDAWASRAPGLKSLEDAMAIRSRILLAFEAAEQEMAENPQKAYTLLSFVIVGGGPTGVELAGAIAGVVRKALAEDFRHIDPTMARVLLVEGQPRVLSAFPAELSAHAAQKLGALGVEVRTSRHVEDIVCASRVAHVHVPATDRPQFPCRSRRPLQSPCATFACLLRLPAPLCRRGSRCYTGTPLCSALCHLEYASALHPANHVIMTTCPQRTLCGLRLT